MTRGGGSLDTMSAYGGGVKLKSQAVFFPSVQCGTRMSAGFLSDPGSRDLQGSARAPLPQLWNARHRGEHCAVQYRVPNCLPSNLLLTFASAAVSVACSNRSPRSSPWPLLLLSWEVTPVKPTTKYELRN